MLTIRNIYVSYTYSNVLTAIGYIYIYISTKPFLFVYTSHSSRYFGSIGKINSDLIHWVEI